jgi:signal recognition particle subunit SRP54
MLEFLQDKLTSALQSLTGKGVLQEADVDQALRQLRVALLEADVALPAIAALLAQVRANAVGDKVLKGLNPGQQVVKLVYDALLTLLGAPGQLAAAAKGGAGPKVVLLAGLQGSGKTTTTGKLARWLTSQGRTVLVASVDVARPAAIEQLATLAAQAGVAVLDSPERSVLGRAKLALAKAQTEHFDVLLIDTAGRLQVADDLMAELAALHSLLQPTDTLLVVDGQTGQVAVQVAQAFMAASPLTGLVLTRMDGDARGGAALSLRFSTGVPIVFLGMGEKQDALEPHRPEGLAGRILGQGDVVALAEKLQAAQATEDNRQLEQKLLAGQGMDFNDIRQQLKMLGNLGGMAGLASYLPSMLPGMGSLKGKLDGAKMDPKLLKRQQALVDSMTPTERRQPALLNARRRQRIAQGAGQTVQDLNKLIAMLEQMNGLAKLMKGKGAAGLAGLAGGMRPSKRADKPAYGGHSSSLQKLLRR